jgi:replicative DNA helicase
MIKDLKIEKQVISTFIGNDDLLLENINDISVDMFYDLNNKEVIKAMLEIKDKGYKVDFDTLESQLKNDKIDLFNYDSPLNIYNISKYLSMLKECQFKRELLVISNRIVNDANNKTSDVFEISQNLNNDIIKLSDILINKDSDDNIELIRKAIKEIEFAKNNKGLTGCPTGFTEVDRLTGGWQKGHLIILAARPAMGKTSLAITEALNSSIDFEKNILFFSLEMSGVELMKRQIALITDIELKNLSNEEKIDFNTLNEKIKPIIDSGFKLIDNCYTLYQIKAQSRKENAIRKLDAIYIDYLQLIKHRVDKGRSKENEVSEISRELKLLAKELDTPIICLSQLSRAVESRGGAKLPQLSDLRDSGSIEQDADIVRFIYRPEYYGISEDENGESTAGKAIIYFAKNRHGATKHITLGFNAELTKFIELEDLKEPKPFTTILPNVDF